MSLFSVPGPQWLLGIPQGASIASVSTALTYLMAVASGPAGRMCYCSHKVSQQNAVFSSKVGETVRQCLLPFTSHYPTAPRLEKI